MTKILKSTDFLCNNNNYDWLWNLKWNMCPLKLHQSKVTIFPAFETSIYTVLLHETHLDSNYILFIAYYIKSFQKQRFYFHLNY